MQRLRPLFFVLVVLTVMSVAAASETVVHVFQIRYASVDKVSAAIQVLLSEQGSLTVQPRQGRITVQDSPEIVDQVADLIAEIDAAPGAYRIQMELLEGTSKRLETAEETKVDHSLKEMFKFPHFYTLGTATFEGNLGTPSSAHLGSEYRVSFLAEATGYSQSSPWGSPDPGARIHLRWLTLEKVRVAQGSGGKPSELLRTSVFIAPDQTAFIGAGSSEDSTEGLVLIIRAGEVGGN
jgi:hypothetical protein